MSYQFARENYATVVEDIQRLLPLHHDEVALDKDAIPLDPDLPKYQVLDERGLIVIYTVRTEECRLVGYAIYAVHLHLHYKTTKVAVSDLVFVEKEHRNFGAGSGLMAFVEDDLRAQGVVVMRTSTKAAHPQLAMLVQSRGHEVAEVIYTKRLV